jgi:cell division protein FtsB
MKEQNVQSTGSAKKSPSALDGTDQPSAWEKAAELIAGDNRLMTVLLKLLLSPFTLLAGAGIIIYLLFRNKTLGDELSRLKEENQKLTSEKEELNGVAQSNKKRYKKLMSLYELEQQRQLLPLPEGQQAPGLIGNRIMKTAFLD